jgi:hypothetical protein
MACNDLVDDAPTVVAMTVAETAPSPAGGTIADGTYALTAMNAYSGAGGATGDLGIMASAVMTISGMTMQQAGQINGQEKRYTSTFTTSGTTIMTMDTCPAPNTDMHSYTATPNALIVIDSESGYTLAQTYSLR